MGELVAITAIIGVVAIVAIVFRANFRARVRGVEIEVETGRPDATTRLDDHQGKDEPPSPQIGSSQ